MKRTAERVLSIVSAVFTMISILFSFVGLWLVRLVAADESFRTEVEMDLLTSSDFTAEESALILSFIDLMEGFQWVIIVLLMISFIATIIGMIFIWNNKNSKLAGAMFIVAGLFAFIITPTSIMLYIAAVLSFTKKPENMNEQQDPSPYGNPSGGSMRPL